MKAELSLDLQLKQLSLWSLRNFQLLAWAPSCHPRQNRLTMADALQHPWLCQKGALVEVDRQWKNFSRRLRVQLMAQLEKFSRFFVATARTIFPILACPAESKPTSSEMNVKSDRMFWSLEAVLGRGAKSWHYELCGCAKDDVWPGLSLCPRHIIFVSDPSHIYTDTVTLVIWTLSPLFRKSLLCVRFPSLPLLPNGEKRPVKAAGVRSLWRLWTGRMRCKSFSRPRRWTRHFKESTLELKRCQERWTDKMR